MFDVDTPEGRMTKIFETDYSKIINKHRMYRWTASLLLPTIVFGSMFLPAAQAFTLLPLALPMGYAMYRHQVLDRILKNDVKEMWLMQNGAQIVVRTADGILHKLNIVDNDEYEIVQQAKSMLFIMQNSGRSYCISTKNAQSFDFNLIDRIVRAIHITTNRSTNVFHHILHKE